MREIRSITYETCVTIAARRGEESCILWPYAANMQVRRFTHTHRAPYVICTLAHGRAPAPHAKVARCPRHKMCVSPDHMEWKGPLLTDEDVICIRLLAGRYTNGALASAFGVGDTTIHCIRHGLAYAHVPRTSVAFNLNYWRDVVRREDSLLWQT